MISFSDEVRLRQRALELREQEFSKYADAFGLSDDPDIPVAASMSLIDEDRYLDSDAKNRVNTIIGGSPQGDSGLISRKELATSAVRMGVGYVAANRLGSGLGSILGLNPVVKRTLSRIGGVAGAVLNSGIL